jgi:hypothetical protein
MFLIFLLDDWDIDHTAQLHPSHACYLHTPARMARNNFRNNQRQSCYA